MTLMTEGGPDLQNHADVIYERSLTGSLFSVTGTPDHLGSVYGIPLLREPGPRINLGSVYGIPSNFTGTRIDAKSFQPRQRVTGVSS